MAKLQQMKANLMSQQQSIVAQLNAPNITSATTTSLQGM
jgi:hypothetical protein